MLSSVSFGQKKATYRTSGYHIVHPLSLTCVVCFNRFPVLVTFTWYKTQKKLEKTRQANKFSRPTSMYLLGPFSSQLSRTCPKPWNKKKYLFFQSKVANNWRYESFVENLVVKHIQNQNIAINCLTKAHRVEVLFVKIFISFANHLWRLLSCHFFLADCLLFFGHTIPSLCR